jgi:hypothetical protein
MTARHVLIGTIALAGLATSASAEEIQSDRMLICANATTLIRLVRSAIEHDVDAFQKIRASSIDRGDCREMPKGQKLDVIGILDRANEMLAVKKADDTATYYTMAVTVWPRGEIAQRMNNWIASAH